MKKTLSQFNQIFVAEEYLDFFGVDYDPKVVNINRLHILKSFAHKISDINTNYPELNETEKLEKYRDALIESYQLFLTKTPLETKLFKVFHQKPNNIVMLTDVNP